MLSREINIFMNYKAIKRDEIINCCNCKVASEKNSNLDKIDDWYIKDGIISFDEAMKLISEL